MSIRDHFPYAKPRSQQIEIMNAIEAAWHDKKYFLVEAPTGTGKSGIAHAIAGWTGSAYVLTETKMLQDQYIGEFAMAKSLKGKSNYVCARNAAFTAETSPCVMDKDMRDVCRGLRDENGKSTWNPDLEKHMGENICPYYIARDAAFESEMLTTNYDFLLNIARILWDSEGKSPMWFRSVAICDEGHCLEDKVASHATLTLDTKKITKRFKVNLDFGPFDGMSENDLIEILMASKEPLDKRLAEIEKTLNVGQKNAYTFADNRLENMSAKAAKVIRDLMGDHKALKRIIDSMNLYWKHKEDDWVVRTLDDGHTIAATPLTARRFFKKMMDPVCDKVVIMSATLGDPDAMIEELGIDPSEAMAIRVDSPFDPNKSPVILAPVLDLSRNAFSANEQKLVDTVDEILAAHPKEKGIIHTGNYATTKAILTRSRFQHRLIGKQAGSEDRFAASNEELVRQHTESPGPTVLISPSMHTGVDLRGDLSTFQIIVKLPFMSLGDERVKKKASLSDLWYANDVWKKIIQAAGRSTRVESDEAITYILDKAVNYQYRKFEKRLPKWFKKRIVWS